LFEPDLALLDSSKVKYEVYVCRHYLQTTKDNRNFQIVVAHLCGQWSNWSKYVD